MLSKGKFILFFINLSVFFSSQVYKNIDKTDFGTTKTLSQYSTTPAANISPGTTDYIPHTNNGTFPNDGYYAVATQADIPGYNDAWIWGPYDHTLGTSGNSTTGYGQMMVINANPTKQGETNGTYYMFGTSSFDVPGALYKVSFWAANAVLYGAETKPSVLSWLPPGGHLKDGYIGVSVRDNNNGGGTLYGNASWVLPRSTDTTNNTLPWQNYSTTFQLPVNYSSSAIYFNFYNSDTDPSTLGNDLYLDDILIQMLVVTYTGKIFIDNNANGIQDTLEQNYDGVANPLYVYIVRSDNTIVSKTQVKSDGTYTLTTQDGVPYSAGNIGLKIVLSSYNLGYGAVLPSSYVKNKATISENVSAAANATDLSTGSVDGSISIVNSTHDNANINFGVRPLCYKAPATTGTSVNTPMGITAMNRAGADNGNWPMARKGGWLSLESKTKGFVINQVSFNSSNAPIGILPSDYVEGMMVYDTTNNCLKIYTTTDGSIFSWQCINTQTCPE